MSRIEESLFNIYGINLFEAKNNVITVILPKGTTFKDIASYEFPILFNNATGTSLISDRDIYVGKISVNNIKGKKDFKNKLFNIYNEYRHKQKDIKNFRFVNYDNWNNKIVIEYGEHRRLPLNKFLEVKADFLDSTGPNDIYREFYNEFISEDKRSDYLTLWDPEHGLIRIDNDYDEDSYRAEESNVSPEEIYNRIISFLDTYRIKYKVKRYKYMSEWDIIEIKVNPKVFFGSARFE